MDRLTSSEIAQMLESVISKMISKPDEMKVSFNDPDEQGVLFILKVAREDAGSVIGKSGKIAESLRVILRSISSRNDIRSSLKIDVPDIKERF
ncbi:MAG: KH domain-containing protein [Candidatus Marinimicrobia bacterium]|nr:KH domain-containing protein [Candidatus Neomarinimicrobiota bacterium]